MDEAYDAHHQFRNRNQKRVRTPPDMWVGGTMLTSHMWLQSLRFEDPGVELVREDVHTEEKRGEIAALVRRARGLNGGEGGGRSEPEQPRPQTKLRGARGQIAHIGRVRRMARTSELVVADSAQRDAAQGPVEGDGEAAKQRRCCERMRRQ